jgi:chitinase
MGVALRTALIAVCVALLSACASSAPSVSSPVKPTTSSPITDSRVPFAPYVDVAAAHPALASVVAATPARRFVLAFALARESRCEPAWAGRLPMNDPALAKDIAAVRSVGGAVTVATGGAVGSYLENNCGTAADLAGAYRTALSATGADRLEVDVEADVPVDLVAEALTSVRRQLGVDLTITAAVIDSDKGLTESTVSLLRALAARGTGVTVNAMLMNFPAGGNWRDSLIGAADSVTAQVSHVWPEGGAGAYRRLGITLMAGRNDTGVITTVADARAVRDYANAHRIGFLGFWSLARDNGDCPGQPEAIARCSGISQDRYAFTHSMS